MLRSEMKEMNKTTYERLHADLMEIKSIMSGNHCLSNALLIVVLYCHFTL